jgi:hypothetical protein
MTREELMAPLDLEPKDLEGWEPVPLMLAGKHAGTLLVKGMEVHFAIIERPAGSVRKAVREMLEPVLDRFGMLTTRVPRTMSKAKKFVRRLGFKPTWNDGEFEYYLLSTLPWERKEET